MDTILAIIDYIRANWVQIGEAYLLLIGGASIIVKLTPTTKDDAILTKIKDFVAKYLALN